ncbi:hypothetical protein [uncultured Tateyamaria sp.]|uniref:hypothetical protein n=1 Tax=uncultured Tateyamaria sp. TaxID=455651 RepID=UPI002605DD3D|nr:hypothetical protein [uncultured Tateyamaria sp.]
MSYSLRFKGLALIINTVLPFVLILGLGLFLNTLYATLKAELEPPVTQLINDARQLARHAQEAARTVDATAKLVQTNAADAAQSVQNLVEPLSNFEISIPRLNIPIPRFNNCKITKISACVGSIDVFKGIGDVINAGLRKSFEVPRREFQKIGDAVDETLSEVNKLKPLAESFRNQAHEFRARAQALSDARRDLAASVAGILQIALWVIGVILIWLALSTGAWVFERLTLGTHLLRHGRYP